MELIFTSRARETAQTMRTFAERALAEGKRQGKIVTIKLNNGNMEYSLEGSSAVVVSEALSGGFQMDNTVPDCTANNNLENFNSGAASEFKIGISGMAQPGYFAACGARGYCGAAVKTRNNNSFVACIKRGKSNLWEML